MFSSRWLALIVLVVLVALIYFKDSGSFKIKSQRYSMMFSEGMVGGFLVDIVGINAGYYYFPRQPFLSPEYWLIVIPCWGVFGLTLNYLWRVVAKDKFIRGTLVTLPTLLAWYEGMNLFTHSWVYTVPFYVVVLGWIPLIYVFAGCDHRREVIFTMDSWARQMNGIPKLAVQAVRYILTVVMFPLLIVSIAKIIRDLIVVKRDSVKLKDYFAEMLMVRAE